MAFNKLAEADNDADPADKVRTATGISKSMRWNVDFSPTLQLYENMVKVGAEDDTVRNLLKEVWADVDFREFMDPSKYVEAISDSPPSISPPISASASPAGKLTVNMVSSDWDVHPVSTLSRGLLQNLLESSDVSLNVVSVNNNDDPAGGGGGEAEQGAKRRADNAITSGKNRTHLYLCTRRTPPSTTAIILTLH